jgi:pyruvate/2-oxoglutarate dehydrogenase complex dihydrolipoamide dehydrogenase (E3) component
MDVDVAKQTQKILQKQGLKFKLKTKVVTGDASGEGVKLEVEAADGGKQETVSTSNDGTSRDRRLT